jgi:UDP-GlcNAc:undecaprenyl-phosphate GlcNAc-1-phosphate transferase
VFIFDVAISVLWLVTLMNAVNFLDNMDGLAAGLTAIASFFFMVIAILQGQVLVSSLAAALCGSTLGFLVYNFNPASTFSGGHGGVSLGLHRGHPRDRTHVCDAQPLNVTWMIPLFVLALPLSDICLVVYTRLSEGRSPSEAGKDHTSHRLRSRGLSLIQALFALYAFCGVFGTLALLISLVPPLWGMVLGCVGFAMLFGWFRWMMALRQRYQLESKGNS